MRLLIISPPMRLVGTERYCLKMADAARKEGWDVDVLFPPERATPENAEALSKIGARMSRLKIGETGDLKRNQRIRFARMLFFLLRRRPDAVLLAVPWPDRCLGIIMACAAMNIPTAVVFQLIHQKFWFTERRKKWMRWARSRRQGWVAVSEDNRKLLCESFDASLDEIRDNPAALCSTIKNR